MGNPYSTISSLCMLHELGLEADHEAVACGLGAILGCVRPDGRMRLAPNAPLYPCYTAEAARTLCRFGLTDSPAVRSTITYLLGAVHEGGGWRCSLSRFGKGPETQCANPGATLYALDVLRFVDELRAGVASVVCYYVCVLSFFERARGDERFLAAKQHLEAAVDEEGRVVVERTHRRLKGLSFCAKGEPSTPATARYEELRTNLAP